MNYRHAYHAGNHADCLKHALLVWLLRALSRKPAPFTVLDTHAGIGTYALAGPEAQATGEWREGIGRLWAANPPALADYLSLAPPGPLYPGSPALVRACLRAGDRLICCELHPEDAAQLRRAYRADPLVAVHHRDGYAALRALLPPPSRRGLVFIDPPYERTDEYATLVSALAVARRRFAAGILAAWVPIKHMAPVNVLRHEIATRFRDAVVAGFWRLPPTDPTRLAGSLLLVLNPPYGFEAAAGDIIGALVAALAGREGGGMVERWAEE